MSAFPRSISSIVVTVGGLALFLIFASVLLISYPLVPTVQVFFPGDDSGKTVSWHNENVSDIRLVDSVDVVNKDLSTHGSEVPINSSGQLIDSGTKGMMNKRADISSYSMDNVETASPLSKELENNSDVTDTRSTPISPAFSSLPKDVGTSVDSGINNVTDTRSTPISPASSLPKDVGISVETGSPLSMEFENYSDVTDTRSTPISPSFSSSPKDVGTSVDSGCDLYHGSWFYDPSEPLYTSNTCPVLSQKQDCRGNGRPDQEYENWRWKPAGCDLPKFDARKFLDLMRGKALVFIGDSVARNQMESLLCLLWQVEVPIMRGSKKIHRWKFRLASVQIARVWSSWLVQRTGEPLDIAPEGIDKLHLDVPDESFYDFLPSFDVVVVASGHWFVKQSAYVMKDEIVGGQLWWPDKSRPMKINSTEAFGIAMETSLTAIATHPNYTGLTIVRSYSPDHYDGGAWNTGGSCTGKVRPIPAGELVLNGNTNVMYEKQVAGFNKATKNTNKSKMIFMDITEAFSYRHDGHPGPYRSTDPNKITKHGPDGRPPPQDCLHWCLPGPIDIWNELMVEIITREFEGKQKFPS